MNLLDKITELNQMVLEGKALDAFEKFYSEDVVMQENENVPTVGKAANRDRENDFFSSITEFRGADVLRVAAGENTTMVEWHMDYTHKDWGDVKVNQVNIQDWKDGQIVREKFYYTN